jgi:hypothetical protein
VSAALDELEKLYQAARNLATRGQAPYYTALARYAFQNIKENARLIGMEPQALFSDYMSDSYKLSSDDLLLRLYMISSNDEVLQSILVDRLEQFVSAITNRLFDDCQFYIREIERCCDEMGWHCISPNDKRAIFESQMMARIFKQLSIQDQAKEYEQIFGSYQIVLNTYQDYKLWLVYDGILKQFNLACNKLVKYPISFKAKQERLISMAEALRHELSDFPDFCKLALPQHQDLERSVSLFCKQVERAYHLQEQKENTSPKLARRPAAFAAKENFEGRVFSLPKEKVGTAASDSTVLGLRNA